MRKCDKKEGFFWGPAKQFFSVFAHQVEFESYRNLTSEYFGQPKLVIFITDKRLVSYSRSMSLPKIVNETQGLRFLLTVAVKLGDKSNCENGRFFLFLILVSSFLNLEQRILYFTLAETYKDKREHLKCDTFQWLL
jgi:hypothetical protein